MKKKNEKTSTPPQTFSSLTRDRKTHHQPGYHKPVKNPTTNYPKDTHKDFCRRCLSYNGGFCPKTGAMPSRACDL